MQNEDVKFYLRELEDLKMTIVRMVSTKNERKPTVEDWNGINAMVKKEIEDMILFKELLVQVNERMDRAF
jgi:hypothetical protein